MVSRKARLLRTPTIPAAKPYSLFAIRYSKFKIQNLESEIWNFESETPKLAHAFRHSRQDKKKVLRFNNTYQSRYKHLVKVKNALRIKVSISNMFLRHYTKTQWYGKIIFNSPSPLERVGVRFIARPSGLSVNHIKWRNKLIVRFTNI